MRKNSVKKNLGFDCKKKITEKNFRFQICIIVIVKPKHPPPFGSESRFLHLFASFSEWWRMIYATNDFITNLKTDWLITILTLKLQYL